MGGASGGRHILEPDVRRIAKDEVDAVVAVVGEQEVAAPHQAAAVSVASAKSIPSSVSTVTTAF